MDKTPSPNSVRWAEIVSNITNPGLVLLVSLIIIASRYASSLGQLLVWTAFAALLLVVPGLLYATVIWRQERHIDVDISRREDRIVPLLLTTLGAVVMGYLVAGNSTSSSLELLSNILVVMLVCLTIITLVWKISLHAATLTALVTLIILFRGPVFAVFYLGIFPVGWARLVLKQHTPLQLVAGSLVGVVVTAVVGLLLNAR